MTIAYRYTFLFYVISITKLQFLVKSNIISPQTEFYLLTPFKGFQSKVCINSSSVYLVDNPALAQREICWQSSVQKF